MLLWRSTVAFLLTNCPIFSGWFALVNLKLRRLAAVSATTIFSRNANRYTCKANLWLIIHQSYKVCVPERWKKVYCTACMLFVDIYLIQRICGLPDWKDLNKAYCTLIILATQMHKNSLLIFKKGVGLAIFSLIYRGPQRQRGRYTKLRSSKSKQHGEAIYDDLGKNSQVYHKT